MTPVTRQEPATRCAPTRPSSSAARIRASTLDMCPGFPGHTAKVQPSKSSTATSGKLSPCSSTTASLRRSRRAVTTSSSRQSVGKLSGGFQRPPWRCAKAGSSGFVQEGSAMRHQTCASGTVSRNNATVRRACARTGTCRDTSRAPAACRPVPADPPEKHRRSPGWACARPREFGRARDVEGNVRRSPPATLARPVQPGAAGVSPRKRTSIPSAPSRRPGG